MQKIRKDILHALFVTPVMVYPPKASDSLGDSSDTVAVEYKGYFCEHNERVLNALGEEVLSGTQIYLRGEDAQQIDILSKVTCETVVNSPIIARKIYRGRYGSRVIGVVYLP